MESTTTTRRTTRRAVPPVARARSRAVRASLGATLTTPTTPTHHPVRPVARTATRTTSTIRDARAAARSRADHQAERSRGGGANVWAHSTTRTQMERVARRARPTTRTPPALASRLRRARARHARAANLRRSTTWTRLLSGLRGATSRDKREVAARSEPARAIVAARRPLAETRRAGSTAAAADTGATRASRAQTQLAQPIPDAPLGHPRPAPSGQRGGAPPGDMELAAAVRPTTGSVADVGHPKRVASATVSTLSAIAARH